MPEQFNTVIEPFRIKTVEPITLTTRAQREKYLAEASYNPFKLKSEQVIIDLLTDSGTSAMSAAQWSGMMQGDEAYAGSVSWQRLERAIHDLTCYPCIISTVHGRAGERILICRLA